MATSGGGALFDRLKEWRRKRAQADDVPAYVVFHDRTLAEIAERKPGDREGLAEIAGVGPTKLERYADEILEIVGPDRAATARAPLPRKGIDRAPARARCVLPDRSDRR